MDKIFIVKTDTKVNRRRGGHYAIVTIELVVVAPEGFTDGDIEDYADGVIEVGSDEMRTDVPIMLWTYWEDTDTAL